MECGDNWSEQNNPLALLEDPLDSAIAFGPLVKCVHLKDYQVVARADGFALIGCALGEGVVDLRGILDVLAQRAPDEGDASKWVIRAMYDQEM